MKRILSMLLCLALVIGFIPAVARAEGESLTPITDVSQITAGVKIVITNEDATKAMGAQSGTIRTDVAVSNATTVPTGAVIFNVETGTATDSFAFVDPDGKYLNYTGSSNAIYAGDSNTDTSSWKISIDSQGVATAVNVKDSTRYIQYNSSSPRFACYKDTQKNLKLWLVGTDSEGGETPDPTPDPEPDTPAEGDSWTLVTDASTLKVGDQIVIVAKDSDYAMSTTQNKNNRGQASVTKNGDMVTFGDDVQVISLGTGNVSGTFAFNTGSGYLYAASGSNNYLKLQTTLNNDGSWKIEIASATGTATIKAQGTNANNWMRYNQSSKLFSCYGASSSQKDICIYKLVENTGCDGTNHTYVDGTCSCGEVAIKMASGTLLYENNIQVRIKFSLADATADAKGMMIFSNPTDAAAHTNPVLMCDFSYDGDNNCYYSYSQGIVAKDMGISAYYVGYAKYGDTYVYTDVLEYSPKIYAQNMLNSDTSAEKTKNLCAALLHYGAAAQKYFDNSLTAEPLMNYNVANLPAFTYNESVLGTSNFAVETGEVNGFTVASANILFDDAITYRIKYIPNAELQGKDLNMEFVIGDIYSAVPINEAGYAYIERKAPKDMDDVITCTPYYLEADGITKVCGPTLTYSGYEYVRRTIENSNDENMIALAKAFAMYIHYANAAFAN